MKTREEKGAGGRGQVQEPSSKDDTFENLEIWPEAIELPARVFGLFRTSRDFGFRDQIQSAATSIASNIAEGYERDSNQELIRFCFIAKDSCGEVRSQAHLAQRVELLTSEQATDLIAASERLSKRISRYIQVRREKFS
jgi:four helix bundle protein